MICGDFFYIEIDLLFLKLYNLFDLKKYFYLFSLAVKSPISEKHHGLIASVFYLIQTRRFVNWFLSKVDYGVQPEKNYINRGFNRNLHNLGNTCKLTKKLNYY